MAFSIHSQPSEVSYPILFIYDASGSMWGELDGSTKKEIAAEVLSETVNHLPDDQIIGLLVYGHREKRNCQDVEFLVKLNNLSKEKIITAVKGIKPLGMTPLAYSATQAINSLRDSKTKATLILITDGIESCDGNICEVITAAKTEGVDFKLHIVGFGLKEEESEQLICAAKAGGGNYYDAADASDLGKVLTEATSETIDTPAKNFSVHTIKNGLPVDGIVKIYKAGTTTDVAVIRTYGDTTSISLPEGSYDLSASALENSRVLAINLTNIPVSASRRNHQTISFDGGSINLITLNNDEGWDCTSKVINQDGKAVGGSRTYGKPKLIEVNPGIYDVKISAMVISGTATTYVFKDVLVEVGKTTTITHNFASGKALIGVMSGDELVDATINLKEITTGKNVAGGRSYTTDSSNPKEFLLSPGTYEIVVKAVKKELAGKVETFTIEVKQGETMERMVKF